MDKLTDFFLTFGFPLTWRSDNMSSFKGELITAMRQVLNTNAKFSQPFHYQSHGAVERVNLTIEKILRKFINEQGKNGMNYSLTYYPRKRKYRALVQNFQLISSFLATTSEA